MKAFCIQMPLQLNFPLRDSRISFTLLTFLSCEASKRVDTMKEIGAILHLSGVKLYHKEIAKKKAANLAFLRLKYRIFEKVANLNVKLNLHV